MDYKIMKFPNYEEAIAFINGALTIDQRMNIRIAPDIIRTGVVVVYPS